jgi:lysophospholipase L1-like esterase
MEKLLLKLLKNKYTKFIILIIFILLITLTLLEFFFRTYRPNYHTFDNDLGWTLKKNFSFVYKEKDLYKNIYYVNFFTNEDGLRPFGDKKKGGKEILILGDSFTTDPYASNNDMWYAVLAEELSKNNTNYFGFAGGGGGYGTFQQLILLEKIKKKIAPDIFILQFCSNDYMNNYYEWEKEQGAMGQYIRRPYFEKNSLLKKKDNFFYSMINTKFLSELKIANIFIFLLSNFNQKLFHNVEDFKKNEFFKKEAINITLELLIKIRKIYPTAKTYIINCDPDDEKSQEFKDLTAKSNFILIPTGDKIKEHIFKEEKIFYKDGSHYNQLGNKLLGIEIYRYLKNN